MNIKPSYESDLIKIFKHSQVLHSVVDKNHGVVDIRTTEDAKAVIQAMIDLLNSMGDYTYANL